MNKYVIRTQRFGYRRRIYFSSQRKAREFAKQHGLPYSQIKRNE